MPKILIVDDQRATRESYARELRMLAKRREKVAWEVQSVASRQAGVNAIKKAYDEHHPFDLILTDLRMKAGDDGLKIMEEARSIDSSLMAILYTTQPKGLDREKAYDLNTFAIVHTLDPHIVAIEEMFLLIRRALNLKAQQECLGALRRHVSRPVYEAIARNPTEVPLRRQRLTVCFWDIRGFSTLTTQIRKLDVLSDFIKEYFKLAEQIIGRFDGLLDKFIGDGVMALFGFSLEPLNEIPGYGVREAVRAAVDFETAFDSLVSEWMPRFDLAALGILKTPKLGCAIHAGDDLVVGYVGGDTRGEFTAIGLDVNLSARVQDMARDENTIVLTKSAKLHLEAVAGTDAFNIIHMGDHVIRSHESLGEIPLFSIRK